MLGREALGEEAMMATKNTLSKRRKALTSADLFSQVGEILTDLATRPDDLREAAPMLAEMGATLRRLGGERTRAA